MPSRFGPRPVSLRLLTICTSRLLASPFAVIVVNRCLRSSPPPRFPSSIPPPELLDADLASIALTEGRAFALLGRRDDAVAKLREALASEPWRRANAEAARDAAGLLENLGGGAGGGCGGGAAARRR